MFDELDDPSPQLRPEQALPGVRARGRALRRRQRLLAATGGGATAAVVAAVAVSLVVGGGGTSTLGPPATTPTATPPVPSATGPGPTTAPPSSETTPSSAPSAARPTRSAPTKVPPPSIRPTLSTPVTPPPTAPPTAAQLELRGDDLAVTRIGAPRAQAVAAVTAVLGPPIADPAGTVSCVTAQVEVAWAQFRLAFDASGRLSGWSSRSPQLRTPSGVSVGTTVARLRQVYGNAITFAPPNPDHGATYVVTSVQMVGALSGSADNDTVVALSNRSCTGP